MEIHTLETNAHYDMAHGMPAVLERDNDGSHLYRFNIEVETGIPDGQEKEVQIGWKCYEVRIFDKPTKANLKKAIIRSVLDDTAEFDLVNSYNKHVLGIAVDEKAVAEYKDYLRFIEDLDTMLRTDIAQGIISI